MSDHMLDTFPNNTSSGDIVEAMCKHPEFPLFYPRRVITPHGYLNVKEVAIQFFWAFFESKIDTEQLPSSNTLRLIGKHLLDNSFQTFWIGRDLGADLLNTQPPIGIRLMDLPWPFTAFTLMLPYGLFLTGPNHHVPYITISVFEGRLDAVIASYDGQGNNQFYSSTFMTTDLCMDYHDVVMSDVVDSAGNYVAEDRQKMLIRALNFVTNVVSYMASEGASVESSVQVGKAKKKGDSGLWSPKWVGQYHKRERVDGGGTHASPRTHWRRGHWRNQRYGEGRIGIKRLWIRPMLVALAPSETSCQFPSLTPHG